MLALGLRVAECDEQVWKIPAGIGKPWSCPSVEKGIGENIVPPRGHVTTKLALSLVAGLLLVLGGGGASWLVWRQPETTAAMRGRQLAERLGCFACHGPFGIGGVADPLAPGGAAPGWEFGVLEAYATSDVQIREWILYGAPRDLSVEENGDNKRALIPMPSYEGLVSDGELGDLVAYIKAVSGWAEEIPDAAFEGRKIASRLGCFGCHGPSGMGGVPNPGSFKGHIPPWDGQEYAELVYGEDELREWILDGKIRRLWGNPFARHFLDQQKTQMPAYRDYVSDDELSKMVSYIRWLRGGES